MVAFNNNEEQICMDFLQGPDDEMFKRIQKELGEEPERFTNNLRILEEWMKCQPHLPKNYDKGMLPIYLRGCKHDMEKTKKKIEHYFIIKSILPEIFMNRDPEREDILETVKLSDLAIVPRLTPQGYRVSICNFLSSDITKFNIDLLICRGSMSSCLRTVLEHPIAGDILVYDTSNLTAAHATILLTPLVRKTLLNGPEAYPNRLRQMHIVNVPPFMERVVTVMKGMLKEKLRDRFYFHSKTDTLKNYIPDYCIPNDYGGSAGTLHDLSKKTHDMVIKNADWLKAQDSVNLIGPIPEKFSFATETGGGAEGSFRKLAID